MRRACIVLYQTTVVVRGLRPLSSRAERSAIINGVPPIHVNRQCCRQLHRSCEYICKFVVHNGETRTSNTCLLIDLYSLIAIIIIVVVVIIIIYRYEI